MKYSMKFRKLTFNQETQFNLANIIFGPPNLLYSYFYSYFKDVNNTQKNA